MTALIPSVDASFNLPDSVITELRKGDDASVSDLIDDTSSATRASLNSTIGTVGTPRYSPRALTYTDERTLKFSVTKRGTQFAATDSPKGTIYWPQWIDMRDKPGTFPADWALVFSTDHDSGDGGSMVAWYDSPLDLSHNSVESLYTDTATAGVGQQMETPRVVYAPGIDAAKPWFMYYQLTGTGTGGQASCCAQSADFVTWTPQGVVASINNRSTAQPGDGHCGYMSVQLVGNVMVASRLAGADGTPHYVWGRSLDGLHWMWDAAYLSSRPDWADRMSGLRISFNGSRLLDWQGQLVRFTILRGFPGDATQRVAYGPSTSNLRDFAAPPRILFTNTETWETDHANPFDIVPVDDRRLALTVHYDAGKTDEAGDGSAGTSQAIFASYELEAA